MRKGLEEEEEEEGTLNHRPALKPHHSHSNFNNNNYPSWKHKLRENCFERVRKSRTQLLWKFRLPKADEEDHKNNVESTLQDIFSDELRKLKEEEDDDDHDMLWEYDGLHTASYHHHQFGDSEQILLDMQNIFYQDLRIMEQQTAQESKSYSNTWEDEQDEYLARVVYQHMQLNPDKHPFAAKDDGIIFTKESSCPWNGCVEKEVWCPICKKGELQENCHHISCNHCELKLKTDDEVNLKFLQLRLGEAHDEHLDRGCRLTPQFCIETNFGLTALYIRCQGCKTFEVVL